MMDKRFAAFFLLCHVGLILLYGFLTEYSTSVPNGGEYAMYQDIHVMIFVGFGFLMAFLQKSGFTTTGHSLLIAAFGTMWAILTNGFFMQALAKTGDWHTIYIGVGDLINGDFAAAALLISFGAVVGRVSATQLLVMTFFEMLFYSFNLAVAVQRYEAADIGGSMVIHTFGAYFGLAVSYVIDTPTEKAKDASGNGSQKLTDVIAMVGTLFLWCYWPSFNAALAGGNAQRAATNTLLGIASGVITAYYACAFLYDGKFRMVEIQNSTLAGGVALGASADMMMGPYGAMIIGSVAGFWSVIGYKFIQPKLESFGLRDTCGVNNLHGMPGIIGGISSIIIARIAKAEDYGAALGTVFPARSGADPRTDHVQGNYQLACLATSIGFGLIGGAFTGVVLRFLPTVDKHFTDSAEWLEGDAPAEQVAKEPDTKELTEVKTSNEPIVN